MRIHVTMLVSLLLLGVTVHKSSAKDRIAVRQIDKPLQNPKGTKGTSLVIATESGVGNNLVAYKFSFSGLSYSINDRFCFAQLPWPVLQYLALKPDVSADPGTLSSLALAFRAGITSNLWISQVPTGTDHVKLFPHVLGLAKMPLSNHFWIEGKMYAGSIDTEAFRGYVNPTLGVQLTPRFFAKIGYFGSVIHRFEPKYPGTQSYEYLYGLSIDAYRAGRARDENTYVSHSLPVGIGWNLGRMAVGISTSLNKSVPDFIPAVLDLTFEW